MPNSVDDETALEEVLAYLEHPPQLGTPQDVRFGELIRQVLAATVNDDIDDEDDRSTLNVSEDLRRQLDALATRRNRDHPFGEHPDGIGPTLGMDLRR